MLIITKMGGKRVMIKMDVGGMGYAISRTLKTTYEVMASEKQKIISRYSNLDGGIIMMAHALSESAENVFGTCSIAPKIRFL